MEGGRRRATWRHSDAVSRIQAGGGTSIYPALLAARDALRRVEARVKHVIVLSDFDSDPGDFRGLSTSMAEDRMTISTVAIGRDAVLDLARNMANEEATHRERGRFRDAGEEAIQPPSVGVQCGLRAAGHLLGEQEGLDGPAEGVGRGLFGRFCEGSNG